MMFVQLAESLTQGKRVQSFEARQGRDNKKREATGDLFMYIQLADVQNVLTYMVEIQKTCVNNWVGPLNLPIQSKISYF